MYYDIYVLHVEHIRETRRLLIVPQIQAHDICFSSSYSKFQLPAVKWAMYTALGAI